MTKVVAGLLVFAALLVFGIAWRLLALDVGVRYMDHTVQQAMAPSIARAQRDAYVARAQAQHLAPAPVGRMLADNERCIGGSVVRVEQVDGVPTYTQASDGKRPIACPQ